MVLPLLPILSQLNLKLIIAGVVLVLACGITYKSTSDHYELKLAAIELRESQARQQLAEEKLVKQTEVNRAVLDLTNDLTSSIAKANGSIDTFKLKLKGVKLTDTPCKPTEEFINLWNSK